MKRGILMAIGVLSVLTFAYIWFAPQSFYDNTPGLSMMGPFSIHFIRDVALAFLVSGGAMLWGAQKRLRPVALAGAAWPFLHALFHVQIWGVRGFPFDFIAGFDFAAVIVPAALGVWAAWGIEDRTG